MPCDHEYHLNTESIPYYSFLNWTFKDIKGYLTTDKQKQIIGRGYLLWFSFEQEDAKPASQ